MQLLGHRGSPVEAVENTLASFDAALHAGADGVELDVRLCATGEVVVCHDPTLDRLAHAAVRVRTTGWTTLSRSDLGGGLTVPLLDDVLALWTRRGRVNVEIKSDDVSLRDLVPAVVRVLDRHPGTAVLVSSFEAAALTALRACRPGVPRGMLLPPRVKHPTESAAVLARVADVAPQAMHPWYGDVQQARVAWWRALGLEVNVWTVDSPDRARTLRDWGVTTVITNLPAVLVPALALPG